MTQKEHLLDLFRQNGNLLTLGQIMNTPFAAEYRVRFTELRREGYRIECASNRKCPSRNLYSLSGLEAHSDVAGDGTHPAPLVKTCRPKTLPAPFVFEESQGVLFR
jgi:hypothetical protein